MVSCGWCGGGWFGENRGATTNGFRISLCGDENDIKLMAERCMNMLETIELDSLHGSLLWYVNYMSTKIFFKLNKFTVKHP